jgi:hypothetical protein
VIQVPATLALQLPPIESYLQIKGRERSEMNNAGLAIASLFALLMIGLAAAEYMEEDEPVWDEIYGQRFNSTQSVSGVGFANSYRYLSADPHVFHSHSSGSGAYSYDSAVTVQNDVELKSGSNIDDYLSSDRKIEVQESVSAAYALTTIDLPGSFKILPMKSLWRDVSCGGNSQGAALTAIFDEASSLNKEIVFKSIGKDRFTNLSEPDASGSYDASMDLKASFNGTGRFGMVEAEIDNKFSPSEYEPRPSHRNSKVLVDEFYRGAFSLEKKMKISIKATYTQNDDDWLPCCFGGYLTEPAYYQKGPKGFGSNLTNIFDCTCSKLMPPSNCSK